MKVILMRWDRNNVLIIKIIGMMDDGMEWIIFFVMLRKLKKKCGINFKGNKNNFW